MAAPAYGKVLELPVRLLTLMLIFRHFSMSERDCHKPHKGESIAYNEATRAEKNEKSLYMVVKVWKEMMEEDI